MLKIKNTIKIIIELKDYDKKDTKDIIDDIEYTLDKKYINIGYDIKIQNNNGDEIEGIC